MLRPFGIFNSSAQASVEMLYPFTDDSLFSDEKFSVQFPDFAVKLFGDLLASTVEYFAQPWSTSRIRDDRSSTTGDLCAHP